MSPDNRTLHQQINAELAKLRDPDERIAWLSSPQQLLNGRIPARMIAIGEGEEVLRALKATTTMKEPTP